MILPYNRLPYKRSLVYTNKVELAPRGLALACALEAGLVARAKGIDFGWKSDFRQSVEEYVLKFGSTGI